MAGILSVLAKLFCGTLGEIVIDYGYGRSFELEMIRERGQFWERKSAKWNLLYVDEALREEDRRECRQVRCVYRRGMRDGWRWARKMVTRLRTCRWMLCDDERNSATVPFISIYPWDLLHWIYHNSFGALICESSLGRSYAQGRVNFTPSPADYSFTNSTIVALSILNTKQTTFQWSLTNV